MRRGDIVRIADGKPRPAVIVQADHLPTPTMILICPFTSTLTATSIYRLTVEPDEGNKLAATSQCIVDRLGPVRRDRIDGVIGRLNDSDLQRLGSALALMLDLGR